MGVPASKRPLIEKLRYQGTGSLTDDQASKYGPELERIARLNGGKASAADIARLAQKKSSPLHEFIWNCSNAEAAWAYRVDRAEYLVRHVVQYVLDEDSGETVQVRPLIHEEPLQREGAYVERETLSIADQHRRALDEALTDLRSFVRRFAHLREMKTVTKAARAAIEKHGEEN